MRLSGANTDTRSVFIEVVRFFQIFRKITVTELRFWTSLSKALRIHGRMVK